MGNVLLNLNNLCLCGIFKVQMMEQGDGAHAQPNEEQPLLAEGGNWGDMDNVFENATMKRNAMKLIKMKVTLLLLRLTMKPTRMKEKQRRICFLEDLGDSLERKTVMMRKVMQANSSTGGMNLLTATLKNKTPYLKAIKKAMRVMKMRGESKSDMPTVTQSD
ncbi:uncharacterized protein LOC113015413 isoform X4 [Astatotilapia calliptera]|uniref:uncharacterized protein LOC113015413 isoform X4 n=1 Tax=Astatotilapia calliptera TaxID=8154 RepID=UPI000E40BA9E|nr:uncharacterized protein LOC113015413 isoform X4 [Astatotilapia calliptera]